MIAASGQGEEGSMGAQAASARARLDIPLLRKDRRLWVWWHKGSSSRLVVVFSSVGHGPDTPPLLEFAQTATAGGRDHAVFIGDPQRSWLNAPHLLEEIVEVIEAARDEVGATQTVTMGYSMGGFAALAIGGFVPVDAALAFSPQLSIDPVLVPGEKRWMRYRKRIGAIRIRSAVDHMVDETTHTILMGRSSLENPQLQLVPEAANTDTFLLPGTGHDSAPRIKAAGILPQVIDLAFSRRRDALAALLGDRMNARRKGVAA
jgi:pimeloyl-ACP methyl ester carboxylesterase